MSKLKGNIQSGIIFIGDPSYMSGPTDIISDGNFDSKGISKGSYDATPEDPYNPFRSWGRFEATLTEGVSILDLPGAFYEKGGRGIALQVGSQGNYTLQVEKNEDGTIKEITIKFNG